VSPSDYPADTGHVRMAAQMTARNDSALTPRQSHAYQHAVLYQTVELRAANTTHGAIAGSR